MKVKRGVLRKPSWLSKKIQYTEERHEVKSILNRLGLNTVCESARCPNLSECFHHKRATFLIMGNKCTRRCSFCAVDKAENHDKLPLNKDEPEKIVEAIRNLDLKYVVITSVTRDDLGDGGAGQFARCIGFIREYDNRIKVEVLTPDFKGDTRSIDVIAGAGPDVFNHNVETVPRLYGMIRPGADYRRSIEFISYINGEYPEIFLKSGLMVGLGETSEEVVDVLEDLHESGCAAVTIGHYLQPGHGNIAVHEYISPEIFTYYENEAKRIGFSYISSGPFVRSSYMAHNGYDILIKNV